jgi:hypothetical protein
MGLVSETRSHYNSEGNYSQELSLGESDRLCRNSGVRAGIHNSACLVPPLQGSGGLSWGRVSTAHAVGFLQWRADGAPARCGESGCEWRRRTGLIPRQSLVVAKELTSETQSTQRKTLGMPRHVWCRPYGAPEDFLGGRVPTAHAAGFLKWRSDGAPARCGKLGSEAREGSEGEVRAQVPEVPSRERILSAKIFSCSDLPIGG